MEWNYIRQDAPGRPLKEVTVCNGEDEKESVLEMMEGKMKEEKMQRL